MATSWAILVWSSLAWGTS